MPDVPVLPEPPAREGEGARSVVDPREVLALRELLDALQAPPQDELAGEAEYRAGYRAWRARRLAALAPVPPPRRHRGRVVRVALVTGAAVATLAGTAAALTGTLPGRPDPAPTASARQAPQPTAPARTPGSTPVAPAPGVRPTTAPTAPGASQAPRTPAPSGATVPASPATTPPVLLPPPTPRPTPAGSPDRTPDTKTLMRSCTAFRQGQLQPGSPEWQVLAAAAGREELIPPYCDKLLGPAPPPTTGQAPPAKP